MMKKKIRAPAGHSYKLALSERNVRAAVSVQLLKCQDGMTTGARRCWMTKETTFMNVVHTICLRL